MKVYRWYDKGEYFALIERLAAAKDGDGKLNAAIFRMLGGAWKEEYTSKQGGKVVYEEVWRDGRPLYLWSQSYSKSMECSILHIEQLGLSWGIKVNRKYEVIPLPMYTATVWRETYETYIMDHGNRALAMAGALLKYVAGSGIDIDEDIPLSARP